MSYPDGWLNDAEAEELQRLARGGVVLELGAWKGRSTVALAEVSKLVVSVDHHRGIPSCYPGSDGDSLPEYLDAVRPLKNVVPVIGEFGVAALFARDAFDLVFVDGIHDFDSVARDLAVAARFTCPTALHDWGRYDVAKAARWHGLEPVHVIDHLAVFE